MEIKTLAFLNWRYPGGGGETVTHHLGHFFHRHGYRIVVYGYRLFEDILPEEDRTAFTIRTVPLQPGTERADGEALARSLREEGVDCLIVQGIANAPFEQIRQQAGCRILFCLHSVPLWEVYAGRSKRVSELPKQDLWSRLEFRLIRRPVNLLTDKLKRRTLRIYARMLPHIDRMIMLCPEYRDQMERAIRRSGYPGCDAAGVRFLSISNPLPRAEEPTHTPKEKVVLYVGRLCYQDKRVDRLLRIWQHIEREVPEWQLRILGRGEEMEQLRELARRLGLQRVTFLGHRSDVAAFYRPATFNCLTSNFEGQPMSLIEGQQYGVIPVSFDSYAAIRRITARGRAGIMVRAYRLRQYAARLKEAMLDTEAQSRMREECYREAARYDLETIGGEWLRLFRELSQS